MDSVAAGPRQSQHSLCQRRPYAVALGGLPRTRPGVPAVDDQPPSGRLPRRLRGRSERCRSEWQESVAASERSGTPAVCLPDGNDSAAATAEEGDGEEFSRTEWRRSDHGGGAAAGNGHPGQLHQRLWPDAALCGQLQRPPRRRAGAAAVRCRSQPGLPGPYAAVRGGQ
mmetsp:Transcript_13133/g.19316  ORF Transcript_13133/g.19316 Transcript_13133/m.19316 type:complete len:169 (-) Transcript_13133:675-1181(-)